MTTVFISYHHANDQDYKDYLVELNNLYDIFENRAVDTGDISDNLTSEAIRTKIRDEYLRESQVTILLCGTETKFRKHIDWELKSSMIDGAVNKKSGILVINLPTVKKYNGCTAPFADGEKRLFHPEYTSSEWVAPFETKREYQEKYPDMPERIIDNLLKTGVKISVMPWDKAIKNPAGLKWLINEIAKNARNNDYDLSLTMRRQNHNP